MLCVGTHFERSASVTVRSCRDRSHAGAWEREEIHAIALATVHGFRFPVEKFGLDRLRNQMSGFRGNSGNIGSIKLHTM